ncbi:hypothetical protein MMC25_007975 [Agyrium rufum]|nr:hypothetical protein [Agyrium rufum]
MKEHVPQICREVREMQSVFEGLDHIREADPQYWMSLVPIPSLQPPRPMSMSLETVGIVGDNQDHQRNQWNHHLGACPPPLLLRNFAAYRKATFDAWTVFSSGQYLEDLAAGFKACVNLSTATITDAMALVDDHPAPGDFGTAGLRRLRGSPYVRQLGITALPPSNVNHYCCFPSNTGVSRGNQEIDPDTEPNEINPALIALLDALTQSKTSLSELNARLSMGLPVSFIEKSYDAGILSATRGLHTLHLDIHPDLDPRGDRKAWNALQAWLQELPRLRNLSLRALGLDCSFLKLNAGGRGKRTAILTDEIVLGPHHHISALRMLRLDGFEINTDQFSEFFLRHSLQQVQIEFGADQRDWVFVRDPFYDRWAICTNADCTCLDWRETIPGISKLKRTCHLGGAGARFLPYSKTNSRIKDPAGGLQCAFVKRKRSILGGLTLFGLCLNIPVIL